MTLELYKYNIRELTSIILNTELTHLGLEASKCSITYYKNIQINKRNTKS